MKNEELRMKEYIVWGWCVLMLFSLNSCLFSEDERFDEPAAQRLNHAMEEARTVLESSDNGWIMEYFPNNATEGYTFLMKFYSDGKTDIASKNKYTPSYTVGSGCWEVIGDNGPVLTFNTFIDNFHLFSDPRNPGQTSYNGVGLAGDYEFILLNVADDLIKLKGKKRETDIVLKRMNLTQDWESYFTVLENMNAALFNDALSMIWTLEIAGKTYSLTNGASHIFTATFEGEVSEDEEGELDFEIPFIITDYGIRFAQALEINGLSVQSFKLNEAKDQLYSIENPDVKITR